MSRDDRRAHRQRLWDVLPIYIPTVLMFMALTDVLRRLEQWPWFALSALYTLKWALLTAQELLPPPDHTGVNPSG